MRKKTSKVCRKGAIGASKLSSSIKLNHKSSMQQKKQKMSGALLLKKVELDCKKIENYREFFRYLLSMPKEM